MDQIPEAMRNIRSTARPLLFRTGLPDAPIATWGTCFLVGRHGRLFAVTARHLVGDNHSSSVVVLPTSKALQPLPLSRGITKADDDLGSYDVTVYEVSVANMKALVAKQARIVRLDYKSWYGWQPNAFTSLFFLTGYPGELNAVDYDAGLVLSSQVVLAGRYSGPSNIQQTIYSVRMDNPLGLKHFRGLSGSPVFCLETRFCSESVSRFCGIAVMGTAESGTVHFLEASVIVQLLDDAMGVLDGQYPDFNHKVFTQPQFEVSR